MRVLYVFPHPDDESFGPAKAISKQVRNGHDVYLLTLTKGEATKMRQRLGYTREEMGAIRAREMEDVARVLDLSGMTILDFPDSGLKEMDPRPIEQAIRSEIERTEPDVLVTYAVHGISGFHDHLVGHAAVKRVFIEMSGQNGSGASRLAFYTVDQQEAEKIMAVSGWHLNHSRPEEIDCVVEVEEEDLERMRASLDCYATYRQVIEETGVRDDDVRTVAFEFFGEDRDPPAKDIFEGLSVR